MGYTVSKKSIFQVEPYLKDLLSSNQTVTWEVRDAEMANAFVFKIRQAIYSSYKLEYVPYNELHHRYKFETEGNKVIAIYKYSAPFEVKKVESYPTLDDLDSFEIIKKLERMHGDVLVKNPSATIKFWANSKSHTFEDYVGGLLIHLRSVEGAQAGKENNLDQSPRD